MYHWKSGHQLGKAKQYNTGLIPEQTRTFLEAPTYHMGVGGPDSHRFAKRTSSCRLNSENVSTKPQSREPAVSTTSLYPSIYTATKAYLELSINPFGDGITKQEWERDRGLELASSIINLSIAGRLCHVGGRGGFKETL